MVSSLRTNWSPCNADLLKSRATLWRNGARWQEGVQELLQPGEDGHSVHCRGVGGALWAEQGEACPACHAHWQRLHHGDSGCGTCDRLGGAGRVSWGKSCPAQRLQSLVEQG